MVAERLFPIIVMISTGLITALVIAFAWRWRKAIGGDYYLALMSAIGWYSLFSAGEQMAASYSLKLIFSKISYIGLVAIAPTWLLLCASYSRRSEWLYGRQPMAIWIVPILVLALVFSNEAHGLIWRAVRPLLPQPDSPLIYTHGPVVYLHMAYAYGLILIGAIWLIRKTYRSPGLYRSQAMAMVAAASLPTLANIFYVLGWNPWPGLDLTAVAFLFTALIFSWNLSRLRMLHLRPVARDIVFESIDDGVVVVDDAQRIIDLNPSAQRILQVDEGAIGQKLGEISQLQELTRGFNADSDAQAWIFSNQENQRKVFDLTINPLGVLSPGAVDREILGHIALLHDITNESNLLESVNMRAHQLETITSITRAALNSIRLQDLLLTLTERLYEVYQPRGVYITLWDEEHQIASPVAALGFHSEKFLSNFAVPGKEAVTAMVLASGKILAIPDLRAANLSAQHLSQVLPDAAILALPLIAAGKGLGAVIIGFDKSHVFAAAEIDFSQQIAEHLALSVAKAQLYEIERRRSAQLEVLQLISRAVVSSLDLDQIFTTVVTVLQKTFNYPLVSIYTLENNLLFLRAQMGYPLENVFHKIPIQNGIMGRAARTRQIQFVQDAVSDPDYLATGLAVRFEISVPLIKDEQVLGILNIESDAGHRLGSFDVELMRSFADQIVVAITNARLFTQTQVQAEKERLLFAATRDFNAGLGEQEVLAAITRHMLQALGGVGCTVSRYDANRDVLTTLLDYSITQAINLDAPNHVYRLADFPETREVILQKQARFFRVQDWETSPSECELLKKLNHHNVLILPMYSGLHADVMGIIELYGPPRESCYSDQDIELAQSLAVQAAVAVENARLYAEVQRLATIDELSGLFNRREFFQRGRFEVERALRYNHPLSTLFVDIDHFKKFNDTYGYVVGDQVIRHLGACLKAQLRDQDVIGRYGGEEFVVLLPETTQATAGLVAERLRQHIAGSPLHNQGMDFSVTVSIGVCTLSHNHPRIESLIDSASQGLKMAKVAGRNRIEYCE